MFKGSRSNVHKCPFSMQSCQKHNCPEHPNKQPNCKNDKNCKNGISCGRVNCYYNHTPTVINKNDVRMEASLWNVFSFIYKDLILEWESKGNYKIPRKDGNFMILTPLDSHANNRLSTFTENFKFSSFKPPKGSVKINQILTQCKKLKPNLYFKLMKDEIFIATDNPYENLQEIENYLLEHIDYQEFISVNNNVATWWENCGEKSLHEISEKFLLKAKFFSRSNSICLRGNKNKIENAKEFVCKKNEKIISIPIFKLDVFGKLKPSFYLQKINDITLKSEFCVLPVELDNTMYLIGFEEKYSSVMNAVRELHFGNENIVLDTSVIDTLKKNNFLLTKKLNNNFKIFIQVNDDSITIYGSKPDRDSFHKFFLTN